MDPFIPVNERVDLKECVKLQLLMLVPAATGECYKEFREATASSSVTTDTTDDGETAHTFKNPNSGTETSLFAGISWPNREWLSGIQTVESELQDEETVDLDSDPSEWWNSKMYQYLLLAQLVRMVWSLPAASVCLEQAFSATGNVLTKKES